MQDVSFFIALSLIYIPLGVKSELLRRTAFDARKLWDEWGDELLVFRRWKHFFDEFRDWELVGRVIAECINKNIDIVLPTDAEYPDILKRVRDFPVVLFCKGKLVLLSLHNFSVVGTRNMTHYGRVVVQRFVPPLVEAGFCITSGMARGIDAEAHKMAIKSGGRTIAVLGTGVDVPFPVENERLYDDILKNDGLIISEFVPGMNGFKWNFPQRNRIIAGLSDAVLVVEGGERSGSLITAGIAEGYGRDVFAVPGPINSAVSVGVNELLKKGAMIATSSDDIFAHYNLLIKEKPGKGRKQISDVARRVLETFGPQGFDVNELLMVTGLQMGELLKSLAELEQSMYIGKDNFGIYYLEG